MHILGQEHTVSKSLLLIPAFFIRPLPMSLLEVTSNRGSCWDITIPSSWKRESTNEPCPFRSSSSFKEDDRWAKSDRIDVSRAARATKKTKIISSILLKTSIRRNSRRGKRILQHPPPFPLLHPRKHPKSC